MICTVNHQYAIAILPTLTLWLPDDQSEVLPVHRQLDIDNDDTLGDVHDHRAGDNRVSVDGGVPQTTGWHQLGVENRGAEGEGGVTTHSTSNTVN